MISVPQLGAGKEGSFNFQLWLSALILGIAIGGAYYDLRNRMDVLSVRVDIFNVQDKRLAEIETTITAMQLRSASRGTIFDQMVIQVSDIEQRTRALEAVASFLKGGGDYPKDHPSKVGQ